jgi:hypothetical protein
MQFRVDESIIRIGRPEEGLSIVEDEKGVVGDEKS